MWTDLSTNASLSPVDRIVYNGEMKLTETAPQIDIPPRERILHVAHDLFYREGIRATGIDRIIAESGVTKVTFYRHFPSKNDLICRYLDYRHTLWMNWFTDALQRHGRQARAIVPALAEWFGDANFRGCAFINGVVELEGALPEVMEIAQAHKNDMLAAIAKLLPQSGSRAKNAQALALAIDGAIIHAQLHQDASQALDGLNRIVKSLQPK